MTREQNIKAVLECVFSESKEELIDIAVNKIMAIKVLEQEPTIQDKQAESEKYQKAFEDGYANGYAQARFDYEQKPCDFEVEQDLCKNCLFGEGTIYCREHCPYESKTEQEPCDDAISREDAIKAQCEACDICGNMRYTKCQYFMQGCNEVKCLRDLPSVTSKPIECDDAISREDRLVDLANAIESDDSGYWTNKRISSALRNIEKLPPVTQKVILIKSLPPVNPKSYDDAISRRAVLELVADYDLSMGQVVKGIHELPSVTHKSGKWTNGNPICPCCGEDKFKDLDADIWSDWKPKYCPNCGAEMESEE